MNQQPKLQRQRRTPVVATVRGKQQPLPRRRRNRPNRRRGNFMAAPAAVGRVVRMQNPILQTSMRNNKAVTTITHREFLGDLVGSTAFNVTQYSINPGLLSSFPWLGQMGNNWESYLFKRLEYYYETSSPTNTSGSVMMAVDFDAADAAPTSKVQMMTYEYAVRSSTWEECEYLAHTLNLEKFGVQRYTRGGNLASNLDIKTYDVGNLFVATSGQADSTTVIGEIYVEYTVEFYTPQSNPAAVILANSAKIASGGSVSKGAPFGTSPTVYGGLPVTISSGNTMTFDQIGQYLIEIQLVGTTVTATFPTLTDVQNIVSTVGSSGSVSATDGIYVFLVNVTAPEGIITVNCTPCAATVTGSLTRVASYAYSLG